MFDIRIVNLDTGSYLHIMLEKALAKAEKKKNGLVPSGLPRAYKDFYSYGILCGRNNRSGGLSRT